MGLHILHKASYAFIVSIISNVHTKRACSLLDYTSKLTTFYLGSYCIRYTQTASSNITEYEV